MRSEELPTELRDRTVLRHRSEEGYKKLYCIEGSQEHSGLDNASVVEVWNNQDYS